jgi:hypothetical protein
MDLKAGVSVNAHKFHLLIYGPEIESGRICERSQIQQMHVHSAKYFVSEVCLLLGPNSALLFSQ